MKDIRPVGIGILLGIIGMFFGIAWAMYLVVGHDAIHKRLSDSAESAKASIEEKFVISDEGKGHSHSDEGGRSHAVEAKAHEHMAEGHMDRAVAGHHDDPLIEEAHQRLTRGHIHEMGLGTITIVVSIALSMLQVPNIIKTVASVLTGIGGLLYPVAWIVMGFRTPGMGLEAADESVMPIAGVGIILVAIGLAITFFSVLKTMFRRA
jgi:hypothetical protein